MSAALLLVLASAEDLVPLHDWPPVGALVGEVLDVARGSGGGLTQRDLTRLSLWSRRWCQLPAPLRHWYGHHAGDWAVGAALWSVLDGRRPPSGAAYGRLRELWEHDHGAAPSLDLVPRLD